jgi:hypothetical protein
MAIDASTSALLVLHSQNGIVKPEGVFAFSGTAAQVEKHGRLEKTAGVLAAARGAGIREHAALLRDDLELGGVRLLARLTRLVRFGAAVAGASGVRVRPDTVLRGGEEASNAQHEVVRLDTSPRFTSP